VSGHGEERWRIGSPLGRLLLFATLWTLLTEGDPGAVWFGVPVVVLATYLSLRLLPPAGMRPIALLRFLPLFFWLSLTGAWDVALRALRPRRPLQPGLADFDTRLAEGLPRVFFANAVSLLPGTLCADLHGSRLTVHLLDDSPAMRHSLAALEDAVARLFGAGTPR